MKLSGKIVFSKHAERRIGERAAAAFRLDLASLIRLVELGIPQAVSIAKGCRNTRIIAVPVVEKIVYLVVTWRLGGLFVITCLTPEMVDEHREAIHDRSVSKSGRSKRTLPGRRRERRTGRRSNRIKWDPGHDSHRGS